VEAFELAFAEVFGGGAAPAGPAPKPAGAMAASAPGTADGARAGARGVSDGAAVGPATAGADHGTKLDEPPRPAPEAGDPDMERAAPARRSALEVLRGKPFADYDDEDRVRARIALRALASRLPRRASARRCPARAGGDRIDVPGTLKAAIATGGEPLE